MPVVYTVTWADAASHRFHVRVELPQAGRLVFPSWAPGSYLMREFARNVRGIHAHAGGAAVRVRRMSRNLWEVGASCVLEYDVYAREKSVRTPFLDENLAFFLTTNLLVHPVEPADGFVLRVQVPAGHVGVCPLGPDVAGPAMAEWFAADVDLLHDSPVSVGPFERSEFTVLGVPHAHHIEPGHNGDVGKMRDALAAIVEAAARTVDGALPYARYDFVTVHVKDGHGGLEHKASSILLRPRLGFGDEKGFEEWATLAAHEHFHAWNVKRIHPDTLGPRFDYANEHYTRNLWWLEGGTVYYEERIAFRAGLVSEARHLERLAELAHKVAHTPGRRHQSLEDSSFDAWIKLYRQGEDSPSSTISYYLKGAVVIWALDLELLARAGKSVDDLLRLLWDRWGRHGVGFPEEGTLEALATELAGGGDFGRWWDHHVRGTADVALGAALAHLGYELRPEPAPPGSTLGVELSGLTVRSVHEDGAAWPILSPGDELLSMDGERLTADALSTRLRHLTPGTKVELLLARDGRIRSATLTTGPTPTAGWKVASVPDVTPAQLALRDRWLSRAARDANH